MCYSVCIMFKNECTILCFYLYISFYTQIDFWLKWNLYNLKWRLFINLFLKFQFNFKLKCIIRADLWCTNPEPLLYEYPCFLQHVSRYVVGVKTGGMEQSTMSSGMYQPLPLVTIMSSFVNFLQSLWFMVSVWLIVPTTITTEPANHHYHSDCQPPLPQWLPTTITKETCQLP